MPLAQHLQTLPVFIAEPASGRRLPIENDLGEILRLARPVTLVFWVVWLAAVMSLGRLLGGPKAGRLALAIVARRTVSTRSRRPRSGGQRFAARRR